MTQHITVGFCAHVDAGKTTLIENMLACAGRIARAGRVEDGTSVLDQTPSERRHGITIYSKETWLTWQGLTLDLLDTPGHIDFASELERAVPVMDCAVFLLSAQDGMQSHAASILQLLEQQGIPRIVFVNKMDIAHFSRAELLQQIEKTSAAVAADLQDPAQSERIALASEELLEDYTAGGRFQPAHLRQAFAAGKLVPVRFGTAFSKDDVSGLLDLLADYAPRKHWPAQFGARIYRLFEDGKGNTLAHLKITGGVLKTRMAISDTEKISLLYRLDGAAKQQIPQAEAGMLCAVSGLKEAEAGQGLGFEPDRPASADEPVMEYEVLSEDPQHSALVQELVSLQKEDPSLHFRLTREGRMFLRLHGSVQQEILLERIRQDCGFAPAFSSGSVILQETIRNPVLGVGHYEPLRHYAEVVLRLSPGPRGSGIRFELQCPREHLALPYQKAIGTALLAQPLSGVLTGSEVTDVQITLLDGRASTHHTEGGDFQEAALRAFRQGLMEAENILLEPAASFRFRVPAEQVSRILYDLEQRQASCQTETQGEEVLIRGQGPVRLLRDYQTELRALTHGQSELILKNAGMMVSADQPTLVEQSGYQPERDLAHPASSVFCRHGAAVLVPWDQVKGQMHLSLPKENTESAGSASGGGRISRGELDAVLEHLNGRNRRPDQPHVQKEEKEPKFRAARQLPGCLIVDGYNMIYSWPEYEALSRQDMAVAREKLIDELYAYQAWLKQKIILVFDGYGRQDPFSSQETRGDDMVIVYTRRSLTADQYIQELSAQLKGQYQITVATSDNLIQTAIFSQGALRMSARQLAEAIALTKRQ